MNRRGTVHQFTAVYSPRDAVGYHTCSLATLLSEMGFEVFTFGEHAGTYGDFEVQDYRTHTHYPGCDLMLYQLSIGSPVADYLIGRPEPLVLNYHNITPAEAFDPWEPHVAQYLAWGRKQLAILTSRAHFAIADSHYNANELRILGMEHTRVIPPFWKEMDINFKRVVVSDPRPQLLYVGRIAPNKRLEVLLASLALLRTQWSNARLVLIGTSSSRAYETALHSFVLKLGLEDCVEFVGSVPDAIRDSYYANSSAYVSASTHEGFGIPFLEAMSASLPIVAHSAAAIPEVVGNCGLLIEDMSALALTVALDILLEDTTLQELLTVRGLEKTESISFNNTSRIMRDCIDYIFQDLQ